MKRALLVIDMIEDFAHEGGSLYCGPSMGQIIPVIQQELARAHGSSELVVYLKDDHLPDDAEFQMFPPHALVGTKGAEIIPELAPARGDVVIPKRRYSGFFGTDLDITLRERGVDT
ncbi:MAG: cysteine hydrolase family protein, partial [Candidatus Limnocylindria bacterium]